MADPLLQPIDGNECDTVADKKPEIGLRDPLLELTDDKCQTVAEKEHQADLDEPLLKPIDWEEFEMLLEKKPQIGLNDPLFQSTDEGRCQIIFEEECQPVLYDPLLQPVDAKECETIAEKKPEINLDNPLLELTYEKESQKVAEKEHQPVLDDALLRPTDEMECETMAEKVFNVSSSTSESNGEELELQPESSTGAEEADNVEYYTLNEANHYFQITIARSHINPRYYVILQNKITSKLPSTKAPVVLKSRGKCWNMVYLGGRARKVFDSGWKKFAVDNELKLGDCCFFELTDSSATRIVFKVIIVRCLSSLSGETGGGDSQETAIIIE